MSIQFRQSVYLILALFLDSVNAPAFAQIKPAELLTNRIDSILQSEVDADRIPGAVIQIEKDGKIIYTKAYGYAGKYEYPHKLLTNPEAMTANHLFDIASLTKVIGTTTSIMLLVDRGLLNVDEPVGKFIPAFNSPEKKSITIRQLLTHASGLYEWYPLYYHCSNKEEVYKLIGDLPLKYPLGFQRKYSDLGFTILGEVIEKLSGLSLEEFEMKNIFVPLGMKSTCYNPLKKGFTKIAATSHGNPYEYRMVHDTSLHMRPPGLDPDSWNGWRKYTLCGEVNDGNAWYAGGGVCGAAGLFSTVSDLQILVNMLMNRGRIGDRQFIRPETIENFLTQDQFNNGLGWMMDPLNSFMKNAPQGSFGHTGFTGTSITAIPADHLTLILLINRQNTGLLPSGEYYNVGPVRQKVFEAVMRYYQ
jgi:CubicO group peptidase (beta-lactamase class C family)